LREDSLGQLGIPELAWTAARRAQASSSASAKAGQAPLTDR
jgi:hypothetical protein